VEVFLENIRTHDRAVATTDLSGRFSIYVAPKANYSLCWESKIYGKGCKSSPVASGGAPVFLSTVNIRIPHVDGFTSLTGHVENEDGSLPRTLEPYFNINAFATVSATDLNNGLIGTVFVNNFGDYLIPGIPVKQGLTMTAAIEKGAVSQDIRPEAQLDTAPVHLLNLRIRNTPPRLDPITAADASGHRIQSPVPGATITLTANARDADGDRERARRRRRSGQLPVAGRAGRRQCSHCDRQAVDLDPARGAGPLFCFRGGL
jgi:hypothetical protein